MLSIADYRTVEELAPLEELWQDLWRETPQASFQQSYPAFEQLACAADPERRFRVLAPWFGGRPFGILPFWETQRTEEQRRLRVLTSVFAELGAVSPLLGRQPAAALFACARQLKLTQSSWDVVEFPYMNPESPLGRRIRTAFATQQLPASIEAHQGRCAEFFTLRIERARLTPREWMAHQGDRLHHWTRRTCASVLAALS